MVTDDNWSDVDIDDEWFDPTEDIKIDTHENASGSTTSYKINDTEILLRPLSGLPLSVFQSGTPLVPTKLEATMLDPKCRNPGDSFAEVNGQGAVKHDASPYMTFSNGGDCSRAIRRLEVSFQSQLPLCARVYRFPTHLFQVAPTCYLQINTCIPSFVNDKLLLGEIAQI